MEIDHKMWKNHIPLCLRKNQWYRKDCQKVIRTQPRTISSRSNQLIFHTFCAGSAAVRGASLPIFPFLFYGCWVVEFLWSAHFVPKWINFIGQTCEVIWDSCDSIMSDDNFTFQRCLLWDSRGAFEIGYRPPNQKVFLGDDTNALLWLFYGQDSI